MRSHFVFRDMTQGYLELVKTVREDGEAVAPRGMPTRELEDATFVLEDPTQPFPLGIGRSFGKAIAAAEGLNLVGGVVDPNLMISAGHQFRNFLDGGSLHGAYGPRIRGQLPRVVETIRRDHNTRQAILQIWDPARDMDGWTPKDLPCTLTIAFRVRKGLLNCSVVMRSNDVWWGVAHDVPMFTLLQLTVADALGLEVGTYAHHAFSLHMYERDFAEADLLEPPNPNSCDMPRIPWKGVYSAGGIEQGMDRARSILSGHELRGVTTPTERWLQQVLERHVDSAIAAREAAMLP